MSDSRSSSPSTSILSLLATAIRQTWKVLAVVAVLSAVPVVYDHALAGLLHDLLRGQGGDIIFMARTPLRILLEALLAIYVVRRIVLGERRPVFSFADTTRLFLLILLFEVASRGIMAAAVSVMSPAPEVTAVMTFISLLIPIAHVVLLYGFVRILPNFVAITLGDRLAFKNGLAASSATALRAFAALLGVLIALIIVEQLQMGIRMLTETENMGFDAERALMFGSFYFYEFLQYTKITMFAAVGATLYGATASQNAREPNDVIE